MMITDNIKELPLKNDLETKKILKKVAIAERELSFLKGCIGTIPNKDIIFNTLSLQEAKSSSEIENIFTTQDELFKGNIDIVSNVAVKEVKNYSEAIRKGFEIIEEKEILTNNTICEIQKTLLNNDAGFRKRKGTVIKNGEGDIIYTPPQDYQRIIQLMDNLEKFINDDINDINPIIKMAIIHYQFESIHPFYDGNGRTGRIINILYLILKGLLDLPVLYLSRYIIEHKNDYYRLLQTVRDKDNWEDWVLFMLNGVIETAQQTSILIENISKLMLDYKHRIRDEHSKIYSQDLINAIFKHPYTRIEFYADEMNIHRTTASTHLDKLAEGGFLKKMNIGRNNYYINHKLYDCLVKVRGN